MDEYLSDLIKFRQKLNNGIHKYEMNGFNKYDNNNEINDDKECDTSELFNTSHNDITNEHSINCSPDITKRLLRLLTVVYFCFFLLLEHYLGARCLNEYVHLFFYRHRH